MPICFRLFRQEIRCAWSLDLDKAGNSKAARMAMMAITTSNSIKVKPRPHRTARQLRLNLAFTNRTS